MKKYFTLIIFLFFIFILNGCSKKVETFEFPKEPKTNEEEIVKDIRIPSKIVVLSPVVVDFIDNYNVSVDTFTFKTMPEEITDSNLLSIKNYSPEYIFIDSKYENMKEKLKEIARVVVINIEKENYYNSLKAIYKEFATIFNKEKEVNYDIIKIEEGVNLIYSQLSEFEQTEFWDYINRINDTDKRGNLKSYSKRIDEYFEIMKRRRDG